MGRYAARIARDGGHASEREDPPMRWGGYRSPSDAFPLDPGWTPALPTRRGGGFAATEVLGSPDSRPRPGAS
jgi:hypothetical protein